MLLFTVLNIFNLATCTTPSALCPSTTNGTTNLIAVTGPRLSDSVAFSGSCIISNCNRINAIIAVCACGPRGKLCRGLCGAIAAMDRSNTCRARRGDIADAVNRSALFVGAMDLGSNSGDFVLCTRGRNEIRVDGFFVVGRGCGIISILHA